MDAIINFWMAMAMYFASEADKQARSLMATMLHDCIPPPHMAEELERLLYNLPKYPSIDDDPLSPGTHFSQRHDYDDYDDFDYHDPMDNNSWDDHVERDLPWWDDDDRDYHDLMAGEYDELLEDSSDPNSPYYMFTNREVDEMLDYAHALAVVARYENLPTRASMAWTTYFAPKKHDPARRGPAYPMIQHEREPAAYYRKRAAGKKRMSLRTHRTGERPRRIYPDSYYGDDSFFYGPTIHRSGSNRSLAKRTRFTMTAYVDHEQMLMEREWGRDMGVGPHIERITH